MLFRSHSVEEFMHELRHNIWKHSVSTQQNGEHSVSTQQSGEHSVSSQQVEVAEVAEVTEAAEAEDVANVRRLGQFWRDKAVVRRRKNSLRR